METLSHPGSIPAPGSAFALASLRFSSINRDWFLGWALNVDKICKITGTKFRLMDSYKN